MEITEKQIVIDNCLVTYYLTANKPGKLTLFFLHGWGSQSKYWFPSVKELADNYNLVFIDLPGFGKSEILKPASNLRTLAGFINNFIKKNSLKQVILVGHSFGGSIAIKLALDYPGSVKALVLVDSAGIRSDTLKKTGLNKISKIVKFAFKPKFMQRIRKKIYQLIGSEDYVNASPEMAQVYRQIIREDLTSILKNVNRPTLLVWGENDVDTPVKDAYLMHQEIKKSELKIIRNAGHFSFSDQPVEFQRFLDRFIKSL